MSMKLAKYDYVYARKIVFSDYFTLTKNFLIHNENLYLQGNHITGNVVIKTKTGFFDRNIAYKIADIKFDTIPVSIESFSFFSTKEWETKYIGLLYIGNDGLSVTNNADVSNECGFVKFYIDMIIK